MRIGSSLRQAPSLAHALICSAFVAAAPVGLQNALVYLLQSKSNAHQRYTGLTSDLKARLAKHNQGEVHHIQVPAPEPACLHLVI